MPARPPLAKRSLPLGPLGLVFLVLPEHEIAGVVLVVLVRVHAGPGLDARHIEPREPPVLGERLDAEVDAAVRRVGAAALAELFDEGDHLGDVIRGSRHLLGALDPQRLQVLLEARDVPSGEAREVRAGPLGELDDPIVDVGHVHDFVHAVAEVLERAPQEIRRHEVSEVPDVRPVVHRGSAGVDPNRRGLERDDLLELGRESVVEREPHGALSIRSVRSSEHPTGPAHLSTACLKDLSASSAESPGDRPASSKTRGSPN